MLLKTPSGRLTGGKEGKAEAAKSAYAPTSPQAEHTISLHVAEFV